MEPKAVYLKNPRWEKIKRSNTQDLVNITFTCNDTFASDKVHLWTRWSEFELSCIFTWILSFQFIVFLQN